MAESTLQILGKMIFSKTKIFSALARSHVWLAMMAIALAAGCEVGPDYHAPKVSVPGRWDNPGATATTQAVATTQASAITQDGGMQAREWWTTFRDPELNSLVGRAVAANLDLRAAVWRVVQARAQRGVAASRYYPAVNSSATYSRSFTGGGPPSGAVGSPADVYQAGFDSSWEMDIFGKIRRGVESADASIEAAVWDRNDTMVTLLAEVAKDYIDLRGYQAQIAIARENLEAQQHTESVTRKMKTMGTATGLDIANAEAQVAATAAQIPELEISAQQSIYSLSVLLAMEPAALDRELSARTSIPTVPPEVPIGLPGELLRRRPDVRRAERQLAAQNASVGAAVADLYPQITLTGSLGVESNKVKFLGDWSSRYWSLGPQIQWPVFDFGRIRSNIAVQKALNEQSVIQYQKVVLQALQDVENAMVSYGKEQMHRRALADAVAANRRAVDFATQLYQAGKTNFLSVLDAQRSLYATENSLVQSDHDISADLVALYKALGGGWEAEAPAGAPASQPAAPKALPATMPMVENWN